MSDYNMSPRKQVWLNRALAAVSKIFNVTVIASADPRQTEIMLQALYDRYPQHKFSWEI